MQDLKDQVIIITGASTGLGKQLAYRLAREHAKLILHARSAEKLQQISQDIQNLGSECSTFSCDLTDEKQTKHAISYAYEAYTRIDILVNIAGIWHEGPTVEHPREKINEMFKVNSMGVIFLIQEILPFMKTQHRGQILNVISNAGVEPSANWGVYCATKYAVRGFTDSLKLELRDSGIKVIGFYPGGMDTDLFDASGFPKKNEPWMMKKEDVAEIITCVLKQPDDVSMDHVEVRKFIK